MSIFIKHCRPGGFATAYNVKLWRLNSTTADTALKKTDEDEEFRVLDIKKTRTRQQRRVIRRADIQPDRADRMSTDQVFIHLHTAFIIWKYWSLRVQNYRYSERFLETIIRYQYLLLFAAGSLARENAQPNSLKLGKPLCLWQYCSSVLESVVVGKQDTISFWSTVFALDSFVAVLCMITCSIVYSS